MINFEFQKDCYGCAACKSICPTSAIELLPDKYGFLQPSVQSDKCMECGLCDIVCIHENTANDRQHSLQEAFLYSNKNVDMLRKSASGGAFIAIAKNVIEQDGYVCGCVFDEKLTAIHVVSNDIKLICEMQGSKYVQSDLRGAFKDIRKYLDAGKTVLFSGTPCQCAAIQNYCSRHKNNSFLYTVAIICHGVPSPLVWKEYKEYLEIKNNSKLVKVNHRAKGSSYNIPIAEYRFNNGKMLRWTTYLEDLYCYAFSTDLFLRDTCYHCGFKGCNITADMIIGDYFDFRDYNKYKNGVSSVIINSEKGRSIAQFLTLDEHISVEAIKNKNKALITSVKRHPNRDTFFDQLYSDPIIKCLKENVVYRRFIFKKLLYKTKILVLIKRIKG